MEKKSEEDLEENNGMIKKLFSHSIIYGLSPQISKVAGIFALPIITQHLTAIDYGIWGIILAYTGAFEALFTLGMGVVLSNSFFKMPCQHKWLWRQIYGFLILWAIPYCLFIAILLYFVIPPEAEENKYLLIVLLLMPKLIFGPSTIIGTYYYQFRQRPIPIASRTAIFGIATVILNIYTISILELGYMGWAWSAFIISSLMNFSYCIPLVFKLGYAPIFNFKWRLIRQSFKVSLPTIPHRYAGFLLNSSDRIVMDNLQVTAGDLGGYNLASNFGGYFQTLIRAANKAVSPMMLACYKKNRDEDAKKMIIILQVIMLILTFLFCIWSKEIFYILIKNENLNKVYPLAIIMIMAYNYHPMYIGAMNKLFYSEKTYLLWRVSFVAGFSNISLNFILIPIFGFEVAAFTTFGCLMYMGFAGHFLKEIKAVSTVNYHPLFWLTVIILLTISSYYIVEFSILIKVALSIGLSIFLFFLFLFMKSKNMFTIQ